RSRVEPDALGDAARRTFDTLANTYRFFALYAGLEGWTPDSGAGRPNVLDRWILSRLDGLAAEVGAALDGYELTRAARAIGDFIVDDLSNWYVRRSRDRFYGSGNAPDTRAAFRTLADTLATLAALLAPYVPFHADWLYRALRRGESVHLAPYPSRRMVSGTRSWRRGWRRSGRWRGSAGPHGSGSASGYGSRSGRR